MKKENGSLVEGDIKKKLIDLTWPMLLGIMGMVIFNLVDTYYVGKLGVDELAAMSYIFPVVIFVNSMAQGVGVATSSIISRNIISLDRKVVEKIASRAVCLGFVIVLIFVFTGLLSIRPVFTMLGAEKEVLGYIEDYMNIWFLGVPFVVLPMIGNNIVRATGDTFTPGMLMVAIAVVNAILDPVMIFGFGPFPEMGIKGAALATVVGRGIGFIIILHILIKREKILTTKLGNISNILATWKEVLYIAVPASLTMLINPVSVGIITRILSGFGKETVAGFGVASKVEMFAMMIIAALGSVMIIFVGQNLSRKKFNRIFEALGISSRFSLMWGAFVFAVFIVAGHFIASLFTDDTAVIEITKIYFYIIGASYGFQGLVTLSTSTFNGINKPNPSAFFSIIRMFVLYVPLAWIGAHFFGVEGVFAAGFTANVVVGSISFKYLHRILHEGL